MEFIQRTKTTKNQINLPAFFNILIKNTGILIKVQSTEFKVQIMQKTTGVFDKNIQKHRYLLTI